MIVLYVKILAYMSIKKIIAFGSAKGGVGKSSITAAVALSMACLLYTSPSPRDP